MHSFSLWAPNPKRVEVEVNRETHPNERERRTDRWSAVRSPLRWCRSAYAFILDDKGEPLPDPRSPSQPRGITGPSQIVDHQSFSWTDRNWQSRPLFCRHDLRVAYRHISLRQEHSDRPSRGSTLWLISALPMWSCCPSRNFPGPLSRLGLRRGGSLRPARRALTGRLTISSFSWMPVTNGASASRFSTLFTTTSGPPVLGLDRGFEGVAPSHAPASCSPPSRPPPRARGRRAAGLAAPGQRRRGVELSGRGPLRSRSPSPPASRRGPRWRCSRSPGVSGLPPSSPNADS